MTEVRQARDYSLDILKGLLVVGMVLAHVIQMLGRNQEFPLAHISYVFNLVTFSAFLFTFGYTTQIAYFAKNVDNSKVLLAAWRILVAFYISGACYEIFVNSNARGFKGLLTLSHIPKYSEFLISFALTLLLATALIKPLKLLVANTWLFAVCQILLLGTTLFSYDWVPLPQLGLFIGGTDYSYFPVMQYFPCFFWGCSFAAMRSPLTGGWLVQH